MLTSTTPTLDHVFASLAAGGPTEDVFLETVRLDRLHRQGLRLWMAFGGQWRWRTDGRRVWWLWQWGVGTDGRGKWGRSLVGQRGLGEGRRRWRGWRCGNKGGGEARFTIAALEKVVNTLAAHDWFERQGPLQALQLKDKVKRRSPSSVKSKS